MRAMLHTLARRFQGLVSEGALPDARHYLLKPMTYMNDSGLSVAVAMRFYKLPLTHLSSSMTKSILPRARSK